MFSKKSFTYEPLKSQDDVVETTKDCSAQVPCNQRYSVLTICFILQAFNVLLLGGGYAVVGFALNVRIQTPTSTLDNYFELSQYNITKHFLGNFSLVLPSVENDDFWDRIQRTDGIVTVPTDWAVQHFTPSAPSPDDPTHSIYQVDAFHSIHCLYRLRNRLISNKPVLMNDTHTWHCVDYLREQLMCHGDMTLQATTDYFKFDKNYGHKCRDHDAMQSWTAAHTWKGHKKYLETTMGVEFKNELVE